MVTKKMRLEIEGMTCEGCAKTIVDYLEREKGVVKAEVSYAEGVGVVTYDPSAIRREDIPRSKIFLGYYSARIVEG